MKTISEFKDGLRIFRIVLTTALCLGVALVWLAVFAGVWLAAVATGLFLVVLAWVYRWHARYASFISAVDNERRLREELSRANQELISDANTDALTGLPNRRAFESFSIQVVENTKKRTQPISLLVLDLDKFKLINDSYGHAAGDQVLVECARRWALQIRKSDMLARIGGEEFCVVLPKTTMAQAVLVAEKIRAVTSATPISIGRDVTDIVKITVTVSVGLSTVDFLQQSDLGILVRSADEALYEAKEAGRNRVGSRRLARA